MIKFEVILTDDCRGAGTDDDPCRRVYRYYEMDKISHPAPAVPFLVVDNFEGLIIYNGLAFMTVEHLLKKGWKPPKASSKDGGK